MSAAGDHAPEGIADPGSLPDVLEEHLDEAAFLWTLRDRQVSGSASHYALEDIADTDGRLTAHLDGLDIARSWSGALLASALDTQGPGVLFVAAALALRARKADGWDRLFARALSQPHAQDELLSAYGWSRREELQGIVALTLRSDDPVRRRFALAVCAIHQVDPGLGSGRWVQDPGPGVRARALRAVGELGVSEHVAACIAAMDDDDQDCPFWGCWSAVLLGDRAGGLDALVSAGTGDGPHRARAFRLALQAMEPAAGHAVLQRLAPDPQQLRRVIQGSGIVGDPAYVPWLIGHMKKPETARLAGEAFTLITGADLSVLQLETTQPEDFESGPNDDPDDPNVALDPDEGLPWPDATKVEQWWSAGAGRFQKGQRYFLGAPVTRAHCIDVLKNGYQRQRILAAHYLCLIEPGTPLFNTSAPAWRQQRLLAQMA